MSDLTSKNKRNLNSLGSTKNLKQRTIHMLHEKEVETVLSYLCNTKQKITGIAKRTCISRTLIYKIKNTYTRLSDVNGSAPTAKAVKEAMSAEKRPGRPKSKLRAFLEQYRSEVEEITSKCDYRLPVAVRLISVHFKDELKKREISEINGQIFYRFIRAYRTKNIHTGKALKRFESDPGDQMQIDFGQIPVKFKNSTNVVHFFTCIMGYSRRIFVKAYDNETQAAWLNGIESAFTYFGHLPSVIVCDNATTLVKEHKRGQQPVYTEAFNGFCSYYKVTPMATRVMHPQSKGKVERAVRYCKENAFAGIFEVSDMEDLNRQLSKWCSDISDQRKLNMIDCNKSGLTPAELWNEEKTLMRPVTIPPGFNMLRVNRIVDHTGLIQLDNFKYKVKDYLCDQCVCVKYDNIKIEIYHGSELVQTLDKAKDVYTPETVSLSTQQKEAKQAKETAVTTSDEWNKYHEPYENNKETYRDNAEYDSIFGIDKNKQDQQRVA